MYVVLRWGHAILTSMKTWVMFTVQQEYRYNEWSVTRQWYIIPTSMGHNHFATGIPIQCMKHNENGAHHSHQPRSKGHLCGWATSPIQHVKRGQTVAHHPYRTRNKGHDQCATSLLMQCLKPPMLPSAVLTYQWQHKYAKLTYCREIERVCICDLWNHSMDCEEMPSQSSHDYSWRSSVQCSGMQQRAVW
jgi:hypothetical protein